MGLENEAKIIHESGKMERADPHQATSGQRDDYILWIDSNQEFVKGMGQQTAGMEQWVRSSVCLVRIPRMSSPCWDVHLPGSTVLIHPMGGPL